MISGSNCCAPFHFHLLRGQPDGTFSKLQTIGVEHVAPDNATEAELAISKWVMRGITRPHLVDWNQDGQLDIVMGRFGGKLIRINTSLRQFDLASFFAPTDDELEQAGVNEPKNALRLDLVEVPEFSRLAIPYPKPSSDEQAFEVLTTSQPIEFEFSDWDRDGHTDLLAIVRTYSRIYQHKKALGDEEKNELEKAKAMFPRDRHTIVWLRNTSKTGLPKFAAAEPLFQAPDQHRFSSFTVVDWDNDGSNEIVAGSYDSSVNYRQRRCRLVLLDERVQK